VVDPDLADHVDGLAGADELVADAAQAGLD
jgi:hypothetical protein